MRTPTHISNALHEAADKARYDAEVKKLLSNKTILAWILKYSVREFQGMEIEAIRECIEGEPQISKVRVRPGHTPEIVTGSNTEDKVIGEGTVTYDIRFFVLTPGKERIKLIMDIEAQKSYYPGYDLVTRGVFYCSRMLSAQLDREFCSDNYDEIKKVYSIFLCMETPKYARNTITEYRIRKQKLFGNFQGEARYDLLSLVMICLDHKADELSEGIHGENGEENRLVGMLNVLLSDRLSVERKEAILTTKYGMEITVETKEAMNSMCNLSELIEERGIERGMEYGMEEEARRNIRQMLRNNYSVEEIARVLMKDIRFVEEIQDGMQLS